MKRLLIARASMIFVASIALLRAQTTTPTDEQRIAQLEKDFHMTREQLEKFVKRELGEPVVIQDDLVVGVQRNTAGKVDIVKIWTPKRSLDFNRIPDSTHPGMQYHGGEVAPNAAFASASDFDGDARVDLVLIRRSLEGPDTSYLVRIDDRFEPASPLGNHTFRIASSGRRMAFDQKTHEWVEQSTTAPVEKR